MTGPTPFDLQLEELDLDQLFAGDFIEEDACEDPASVLAADKELQLLTRKISGQYVEIVATWARGAFQGSALPGRGHISASDQVDAALPALHRLAEATDDQAMCAALDELRELAALDDGSRRGRQLLVPRLRDWLHAFAGLLEGEDARRLRDLVEFDRKAFPLLDGLAEVHGIGPRRLQRLYMAGLFTVESLFEADPAEVAMVSGLPGKLSERVVEAASRFERQWRHQVAEDLRRRTDEVRAVLAWIESSGRQDDEVLSAVQASVEELRQALAQARNNTLES